MVVDFKTVGKAPLGCVCVTGGDGVAGTCLFGTRVAIGWSEVGNGCWRESLGRLLLCAAGVRCSGCKNKGPATVDRRRLAGSFKGPLQGFVPKNLAEIIISLEYDKILVYTIFKYLFPKSEQLVLFVALVMYDTWRPLSFNSIQPIRSWYFCYLILSHP